MKSSDVPYREDVLQYVGTLKRTLHPELILLHGSVAGGTFGLGSDVDGLDRSHAPIDAKAYTPGRSRG
ncbi:nucleotidyltransferase family protein [Thermococcus celer]|uniref:Uncharacterized protein n=1 Tax=Thermococcus celer Vu 13 = JCM 8558 TaxID=1293037 RepID=A0A218P243_THECE|nr:hypothetical protein [Thermococcus celer]ASI98984.1 hypothetical protein A3L02_05100 [Thermococcus celer Vu 13 = JCM 8558]